MPKSSARLLSASVALAARQWKAMGVALAGRDVVDHQVIDPEALICFTAALGDADARLRDESMDWCVKYGRRLISASRLRNIRASFPAESGACIDEYLATANEHGGTRWSVHDDSNGPRDFVPSGKSSLPRLRKSSPLLRLQLRALFGVTARAEVILALSTRQASEQFVTASELAFIGYGKRNIALVLEDLALGELVSRKKTANRVGYRLQADCIGSELAPAVRTASLARWELRFALLNAAGAMVDRVEAKKPVVRSVEAVRFATEHARDFDALELEIPEVEDPNRYFEELVEWVEDKLVV